MRILLTVTAVIEAGAGLVLLAWPSGAVPFLFGAAFDAPIGLAIARCAGAALLALGIACWFARNDDGRMDRAATGLVAAILFYNSAIVAIFASARIRAGLVGMGFWPAVVVHSAMAVWCVERLHAERVNEGNSG